MTPLPTQDELQNILTRFKRQVQGKAGGAGYEQTMADIRAWALRIVEEALDNVAVSVKQHTVPEGRRLATRSYVMNTLEYERSAIKSRIEKERG